MYIGPKGHNQNYIHMYIYIYSPSPFHDKVRSSLQKSVKKGPIEGGSRLYLHSALIHIHKLTGPYIVSCKCTGACPNRGPGKLCKRN